MHNHPPFAFWLDRISHPRARVLFIRLFFVVSLILCVLIVGSYFARSIDVPILVVRFPLIGLFFLTSAFFLAFTFVEFYYRSNLMPFRLSDDTVVATEVARIFSYARGSFDNDLPFAVFFSAFSETFIFRMWCGRLGFSENDFQEMVSRVSPESTMNARELFSAKQQHVMLADVLVYAAKTQEVFKKFLFDHEIKEEILFGASRWVEEDIERENVRQRWWLRENLERMQGIGKDLGYGYTYNLNEYASEVIPRGTRFMREARGREIDALEEILARSREANVLLVGETGSGKHTVVEGLAERIAEGGAKPALEHKRIMMLDAPSITARASTKGAYEGVMITMLGEATEAGNIILAIENFPGFLESAHAVGADALDIMGKYISGSSLQVIALSDLTAFHKSLEPNGLVTKLFEKVDMHDVESASVVRMLEDATRAIEFSTKTFFTYGALVRAEELARRFIPDGAMPEKAIDLLDDAASRMTDRRIVLAADIDAVVERRTAIPVEQATGVERDKLLNMEALLHERVINQKQAIAAIASSLRRARSGLRKGVRPIGSFLFVGPTGVGKTETARALAEVYFGNKDAMLRFDMSEYEGADGMRKLIGSFDAGEPGVLSSRLRERPFSLLLFDEFEKASREVHNLFLQILDEGSFSDAMGRKVSAKETIIIATSNAGAHQVWELVKAGKDPSEVEDKVIEAIRTEGILLPELLNRFDAFIVFHPLSQEQLVEVAMLMLRDVAKRLEEQEVHFVPTRELAGRIAELGYDPAFGARPMRRVIQNRLEELIAKKLLGGNLKRGDSFSLSSDDIKDL